MTEPDVYFDGRPLRDLPRPVWDSKR